MSNKIGTTEGFISVYRDDFQNRLESSVIHEITVKIKGSVLSIIDQIDKAIGQKHFKYFGHYNHIIDLHYNLNSTEFLIGMSLDYKINFFEENNKQITLSLIGTVENVQFVSSALKQFVENRTPSISWFHTDRGTLTSKRIEVTLDFPVHNEFYPYFDKPIDLIHEEFFNSNSNVILLYGPAGTGKTNFIKKYIYKYSMKNMVTYDERILESDEFYIKFITGDYTCMIVEDADTLLYSRERDRNATMSKILNSSDGLISSNKKKIIFSTNLENLNKVDDALLRPGRCFGAFHFRNLTAAQAKVAAYAAGRDIPTIDKEFSLGEIFNISTQNNKINKKVGF